VAVFLGRKKMYLGEADAIESLGRGKSALLIWTGREGGKGPNRGGRKEGGKRKLSVVRGGNLRGRGEERKGLKPEEKSVQQAEEEKQSHSEREEKKKKEPTKTVQKVDAIEEEKLSVILQREYAIRPDAMEERGDRF